MGWCTFLHIDSSPRFGNSQCDFSKAINTIQCLKISQGITNRAPLRSGADQERQWSRTHSNVGACKTSPAEEINEPVEAGQPAAALLLSFTVRRRLVPVQIVDWSHRPEACREQDIIDYAWFNRVCRWSISFSSSRQLKTKRKTKRREEYFPVFSIWRLCRTPFWQQIWPPRDLPRNTIKTGCNRLCQPH